MVINVYDPAFDESKGFLPEEAEKLIPKVEISEPYNEGENVIVTYWKHMRKCQLYLKEYQLNPTDLNLNQLLSLLFELPPPYEIDWVPKNYRKQFERMDRLRMQLMFTKPFLGAIGEDEQKRCQDKYCSFCNHRGLIAHVTFSPPISVKHLMPDARTYIDAYWCPNCETALLPSETYGELT